MKRLILLILILVSGCKSDTPDIPKDVIPMDKMQLILTDMHIADAVAETKAQTGMNERLLTEEYHHQILINHGISREKFVTSYKFYESKPELMDKIYDDILVDLSKREETTGKK